MDAHASLSHELINTQSKQPFYLYALRGCLVPPYKMKNVNYFGVMNVKCQNFQVHV